MVDSPSEMSSELLEELTLSLNWHAAILAVLLEEAGGVVEVKAEDIEKIDVARAKVQISFDEENNMYTIERLNDES